MSKNIKKKPILDDITRGRYREVINLKPQIKRRLIFSLLTFILAVTAVVFLFYSSGTTAQVAKFYPQACLGNWLEPSLAEGEPNTIFSADWENFNSTNSTLYDGGFKQIFCGGFTGNIPEIVEIQKVSLKIHWAKSKKREVISTFPTDEVVEKIIETSSNVTSTAATSTNVEEINEEEEVIDDSQEQIDLDPENNEKSGNNKADIQDEIVEESPVDDPAAELEIPVNTGSKGEAVSVEEQSWLHRFFHITEVQATTTTSTIEFESEPNLSDIELTTSTDIVNEQEIADIATFSTFTVTTTPTFIEAFPDSDEIGYDSDALFVIRYSLDGINWQVLSLVYEDNWPGQFDLPLTSFTDLTNIQISVESLLQAEDNLVVFLDGMILEVKYEATTEIIQETQEEPVITEEVEVIKPVRKTFDERSQHQCLVEPFVQRLNFGTGTTSNIILEPTRINANKKVELGDLPQGVIATIDAFTATSADMMVHVNPQALKGSYNVVVIYEEEQYDGEFLPNFCQFNLIIE